MPATEPPEEDTETLVTLPLVAVTVTAPEGLTSRLPLAGVIFSSEAASDREADADAEAEAYAWPGVCECELLQAEASSPTAATATLTYTRAGVLRTVILPAPSGSEQNAPLACPVRHPTCCLAGLKAKAAGAA